MGTHGVMAALCALALAGCPTVDLGDTPPDIGLCNPSGGLPYFQSKIWPMFLHPSNPALDCAKANCHLLQHGLTLDPSPPVDFQKEYRVSQSYLNCETPEASPLLTKPLAGVNGHAGGDLFTMSDPQYQLFLDWFK